MDEESEQTTGQLPNTETVHEKRHRRPHALLSLGLASLAVACVLSQLAFCGWRRVPNTATFSHRKPILVILPLDHLSRLSDRRFFYDGLTEVKVARMGKRNWDEFTVVARSPVAEYKSFLG